MTIRTLLAAVALSLLGLTSSGVAPSVAADQHTDLRLGHPCTRTSSGTCIQGGQFCPQASFGKSGWDAKGRRYVCKGNRTHPHWMKP